VNPLDEAGSPSTDVCLRRSRRCPTAGSWPLGGSRYEAPDAGAARAGLDYAQLFDPQTSTFRRIAARMLGGGG
jgi:hypothetical protein